jgi:pimeloyl-ACP methyl ester carboxylesterase/DNA-binding winged helix-turn-helix (wHTH) protein
MRHRFGRCELRDDTQELLLDGIPRKIVPQVFDLLRYLVSHAGLLVSRDDLVEAVWGGRHISDAAISSRISAARTAVGDDGGRQEIIRTVPRRGFRFIADVKIVDDDAPTPSGGPSRERGQRIGFCRSSDGTQIALATTGAGPPLVRAGHWLTHLESDWHSPVWRPVLDELDKDFQVIRYDQRGNGLSDWEVDDLTLDAFVADLEAVVDAAGLGRFDLYGVSQGAPIAVAYAARHPQRLRHLILHGGYVRGRLLRGSVEEVEQAKALLTLITHQWGKEGSPFIQAFASMFIPDGTKEQISSLAQLQRTTTLPQNAARLRAAVDSFDVSELLDKVRTPTLVIHARNDGVHPLDQGRALAAGIKNAEFVMLESPNHITLAHEPAWPILFDHIRQFTRT